MSFPYNELKWLAKNKPTKTIEMSEMVKISAVFTVKKSLVVHTENWMNEVFDVTSYRILPDTEELYEKSKAYQKLTKQLKKIRSEMDDIINESNLT